ncbi:MAG: dihydrolipoamide acetyltransferase family protein [Actinomycetota bacterium]
MAEIFHLPKMGQTMTEATILKWLKNEGDHVEGWEAIVEMMTDKIDMEVEPTITGTILKIIAPEGAVVPVGGPVAIIGAPNEDISGLLASLQGGAGAAVAAEVEPASGGSTDVAEVTPKVNGNGHGNGASALPPSREADEFPSVSPRARELAESAGVPWKSLEIEGSGFEGMIVERDVESLLSSVTRPPAATPLAAKIAADLGVPLDELSGSGPRGRVRAEDVRRAGSGARRGPAIEERRIPLQGMRKVIAGRLLASYQGAVHVPVRVDADMTAAADLRRQLKPALEASGARLTYTDLIAAAVAQALVEQPLLNATLEDETVHIHPNVNLGIAVALEEGLTVPVIPQAESLRLADLSIAIQDTAKKARTNQLPPSAYSGGTFTITNLGQFGIDSFDPIINPPQVAILGVGRIQDRVVAVNGAPTVRPMMTLTVTFDHRATDGAPASQFLSKVKELLENPARLLL